MKTWRRRAIFRALIETQNEGSTLDFGNLSRKTDDDSLATELLPLLLMGDLADDET